MATAVANSDVYSLKRYLGYSLWLHGGLALALAVSAFIQYHGNFWGGVGGDLGGTKVTLVSNAGIPMPQPKNVTESKTVDPTMSVNKEELVKPPEPKIDATKIPKFTKEKPPPPQHKSKALEDKTPPPDNAVPYGQGGGPKLPTGYSQNPGASSGVSIQGQGEGDFNSRYGWYVEAMKRKISQNWQQSSIDPAVLSARRAHSVVEFTINRDGSVKGIRLLQTSGNSSMDTSGVRAIYGADHFDRLPSDYSGSYVLVTFDFDLALSK
jgi:TonB family protein